MRQVTTVSLPEDLEKDLVELSSTLGISKSAVICAALRVFIKFLKDGGAI